MEYITQQYQTAYNYAQTNLVKPVQTKSVQYSTDAVEKVEKIVAENCVSEKDTKEQPKELLPRLQVCANTVLATAQDKTMAGVATAKEQSNNYYSWAVQKLISENPFINMPVAYASSTVASSKSAAYKVQSTIAQQLQAVQNNALVYGQMAADRLVAVFPFLAKYVPATEAKKNN